MSNVSQTWWYNFALEKLLKHQVVVHRFCHDFGYIGVSKLDEGVPAGRSGLLAPA